MRGASQAAMIRKPITPKSSGYLLHTQSQFYEVVQRTKLRMLHPRLPAAWPSLGVGNQSAPSFLRFGWLHPPSSTHTAHIPQIKHKELGLGGHAGSHTYKPYVCFFRFYVYHFYMKLLHLLSHWKRYFLISIFFPDLETFST